jgi:hypothetical protein
VHFVEHQLKRILIREPMAQNQFDAIVSWAFNIGCERASKSTLVRLFNLGDDKEAANEFLRWNSCKIHGQKVRFKSLTNRRNTERQLFASGLLIVRHRIHCPEYAATFAGALAWPALFSVSYTPWRTVSNF